MGGFAICLKQPNCRIFLKGLALHTPLPLSDQPHDITKKQIRKKKRRLGKKAKLSNCERQDKGGTNSSASGVLDQMHKAHDGLIWQISLNRQLLCGLGVGEGGEFLVSMSSLRYKPCNASDDTGVVCSSVSKTQVSATLFAQQRSPPLGFVVKHF